jgi:hypothetical protein
MAELARPWSAVELGVSIEVIADFIERDVEEARQKAAALGLLPIEIRSARRPSTRSASERGCGLRRKVRQPASARGLRQRARATSRLTAG